MKLGKRAILACSMCLAMAAAFAADAPKARPAQAAIILRRFRRAIITALLSSKNDSDPGSGAGVAASVATIG